jgi:hypothetical protein
MSLPLCGVQKCCGPCTYSVGDLVMPGSDLGSWVNYIAGSLSISMPGLGTSWNVLLRHQSTSASVIIFRRAYTDDGTVEVRYLQNPSSTLHRAIYLRAERPDGVMELSNDIATPTSPNNWSGTVSGVFVANPCNYSIPSFTPSRIYTAISQSSVSSVTATQTYPSLSTSDWPATIFITEECKAESTAIYNALSVQSLTIASFTGLSDGWVLSPVFKSEILPSFIFSVQTQITIPSGATIATSDMFFNATLARGYGQGTLGCIGGGSANRSMKLLTPPFGSFSAQYFGDMTSNNFIYNNAVLSFTP